jgi:hypothetical protein
MFKVGEWVKFQIDSTIEIGIVKESWSNYTTYEVVFSDYGRLKPGFSRTILTGRLCDLSPSEVCLLRMEGKF